MLSKASESTKVVGNSLLLLEWSNFDQKSMSAAKKSINLFLWHITAQKIKNRYKCKIK